MSTSIEISAHLVVLACRETKATAASRKKAAAVAGAKRATQLTSDHLDHIAEMAAIAAEDDAHPFITLSVHDYKLIRVALLRRTGTLIAGKTP